MRVLPQVEEAAFDIPGETFTLQVKPDADVAGILAAIEALGYEPKIVEAAPEKTEVLQTIAEPTSSALRAALARAASREVPLVVDFGGPFCSLCRKFEETSLADAAVKAKLATLEFLQIDVEEDEAAAKDLDVHGIPDLWVLDGKGHVLARHNGYLNPKAFLAFLEAIDF